jgi:hypothetical protein
MGRAGLLFLVLGMGASAVSQQTETSSTARPVAVVIRTDHEKYSLADSPYAEISTRVNFNFLRERK